jgi:putative copper export protein
VRETLHALHLIAAALWIGGTFALIFAGVPVIRTFEGAERARALRELGERWRPIGWGSLLALGVTGLAYANELDAFSHERIHSEWGVLFFVKMGLVGLLVLSAFLHDFVLGPRLARQVRAGEPQTLRSRLVWVGWGSFALTFAIPIVGVVLSEI